MASTPAATAGSVAVQLTDVQRAIYEAITAKDVGALKTQLALLQTPVDFIDENGMTPLQHACYKQTHEAVQSILDQVHAQADDVLIGRTPTKTITCLLSIWSSGEVISAHVAAHRVASVDKYHKHSNLLY